ncbi:MAG: hypothetical protein U9N85_05830 [Bacteroidota bacterium]|nr:hypothetical protein [Bacteroidota bacterium]
MLKEKDNILTIKINQAVKGLMLVIFCFFMTYYGSAQISGPALDNYKSLEWEGGGVFIRPTYESFKTKIYDYEKRESLIKEAYEFKNIMHIPAPTDRSSLDSLHTEELNSHFRENLAILLTPISKYAKEVEKQSSKFEEFDNGLIVNMLMKDIPVVEQNKTPGKVKNKTLYFINAEALDANPKFAHSLRKEYNAYARNNRIEGGNFEYHLRYLKGDKDAYCILPSGINSIFIVSYSFRGLTYGKNDLLKSIRDNKLPAQIETNRTFGTNNKLRIANIYQNPFPENTNYQTRDNYLTFRYNNDTNSRSLKEFISLSRVLSQLRFNAVALPVDPQGLLLKNGSDAAFITFAECMQRNDIKVLITINLYMLSAYKDNLLEFVKRHKHYIAGIIVEAGVSFNSDKRYNSLYPGGKKNANCEMAKELADNTLVIWRDKKPKGKAKCSNDKITIQYLRTSPEETKLFFRHFIQYMSISWHTNNEYDSEKTIILYFHTEKGGNYFKSLQTN